MYDGLYGEKTNESLFLLQQYMLNNYTLRDYNFLQNQYQCNSPTQSILSSQQSQQCCSTYSMMNDYNRLQNERIIDSLQSQISNIKAQENIINAVNPMIGNYNAKEKSIDGDSISKNTNKDSISNYMDKEFLYESELKEIEDKFHFKFRHLGFNVIKEKNAIYKVSKQIIDKIKLRYLKYNKEIENLYVSKIVIYEYGITIPNNIYVYCNDEINFMYNFEYNIGRFWENSIMSMCNMLLKQDIPEYQKFYEKYKNRIVKDYECEDLSFYEKILQESS